MHWKADCYFSTLAECCLIVWTRKPSVVKTYMSWTRRQRAGDNAGGVVTITLSAGQRQTAVIATEELSCLPLRHGKVMENGKNSHGYWQIPWISHGIYIIVFLEQKLSNSCTLVSEYILELRYKSIHYWSFFVYVILSWSYYCYYPLNQSI